MVKPDSEDALLSECGVERLKSIAKDMLITGFARLNKEPLTNLIREHMERNTNCGICGGGQCLPASHYFPPRVPRGPGSNSSSPDHNLISSLGHEFHGEHTQSVLEEILWPPSHVVHRRLALGQVCAAMLTLTRDS